MKTPIMKNNLYFPKWNYIQQKVIWTFSLVMSAHPELLEFNLKLC